MLARVYHTAMILLAAILVPLSLLEAPAPAPHLPAALALAPASVALYSQAPSAAGGLLHSSLRDPEGSGTDQWVWDGFTLNTTQDITEVRWRGGYDPFKLGSGGPVVGFQIAFYASIPSGFQPDLSGPPLATYEVTHNANETPSAVLGGAQTYDYHYVLPQPFQASGQAKYWVQIEAFQGGAPDWGLSSATSGDGQYFRRIAGEGMNYQVVAGDAAFSLWGAGVGSHRSYLPLILK